VPIFISILSFILLHLCKFTSISFFSPEIIFPTWIELEIWCIKFPPKYLCFYSINISSFNSHYNCFGRGHFHINLCLDRFLFNWFAVIRNSSLIVPKMVKLLIMKCRTEYIVHLSYTQQLVGVILMSSGILFSSRRLTFLIKGGITT
jgi:hypothetical protein